MPGGFVKPVTRSTADELVDTHYFTLITSMR